MFNIKTFIELDSTNKYCKDNIDKLDNFDVIFALKQINGKGRMIRKWISNEDSLTFSIVIKDKKIFPLFNKLSLLVASSVYLALNDYIKKDLSIKWPNDIYYKDSKICGILLESISIGEDIESIIVGIGVNVNNSEEFIINIDKRVTSMFLVNNIKYSKNDILNKILNEFDNLYLDLINGGNNYFNIIKENNYLLNKFVYAYINDIKCRVKVKDILANSNLLVELDKKEIQLSSLEVTFH